ncbi:hypothetical protein MBLNU13_g00373t1 [Cladosporium sp. NU13]
MGFFRKDAEQPTPIVSESGTSSPTKKLGDEKHEVVMPTREVDAAEEQRLIRKLDRRIVPMMVWMYLMSFMDRVSIGNARLYGMEVELGMQNNDYLLAVSVLFITYCLFETPSNAVLKRMQPARWLGGITFAWGLVATFSAFCNDKNAFIACRLLLGIFEAGLFPGFLVYLSMFYNKGSIALRVAYLFSTAAWAGALGGLVAYGIGFLDGTHGWAGWRWIFLINGIPTIVTGVVAPFVLPNSPDTAKFLTEEERESLRIIRRREVGQTASSQLMNKKDAMDALKDWKTWVISSGQYCLNSMLYSFSVFLPTIINLSGNGWSSIQVQALTVPIYVLGGLTYLACSWYSDRIQQRGPFAMASISLCILGYILLIANINPEASFAGCFIVAMGLYTAAGTPFSWGPVNNPRYGKRAIASGIQLTIGNASGVAAPFLFSTGDSPRFVPGYAGTIAMLAYALAVFSFMHFYFKWDNKKKLRGDYDHLVEGMTEEEANELGERNPSDGSNRTAATTTSGPSLTAAARFSLGDQGTWEEEASKNKDSNRVKRNFKRLMAAVQHAPRPHLRRNSPVSTTYNHSSNTYTANGSAMRHIDVNDSDSDDEPPPVFTFSKVTEALLNDGPMPPSSPPRNEHNSSAQRFVRSASAPKNLDTPSRAPAFKIVRNSSPSTFGQSDSQDRGKTPPRIVQLGSAQKGSERRTIAIGGPYPQRFAIKREPTPQAEARNEIVTPAPASRTNRMSRTRAGSNASQDGHIHEGPSSSRPGSRSGSRSGYKSSSEQVEPSQFASSLSRHTSMHQAPDTVSRYAPSTVSRSRNPSADTAPPPGSTRIKRAPIGTGTFLRSGPVRRGFKRRDSEENISPADGYQSGSGSASKYASQEDSARSEAVRSRNDSVNVRAPSVEPVSVHDYAHEKHGQYESRPSSRQASNQFSRNQSNHDGPPLSRQTSLRQASVQPSDAPMAEVRSRRPSNEPSQARPTLEQVLPQRAPSNRQAQRPAPSRVHVEDQENIPPPTFKRNKDQEFRYLGRQTGSAMSDDEKAKPRMVEQTPVPVPAQQQDRKALGAMSGNTPHRPAPPPPPKMSVLETATATAGASTTKSRKKRSHMVVKGKIFTQMGRLGKGGSSDVYCVMAENYKTFALKRVKLDDCDENAVKGYKGEIDLLKQLTDVERVVRLYDWELLEEKQELLVLMEKGETDLNRLLTLRINGVDAKFDSAFVRYHWQEMLDCVASVHEQEIVHSDLKPANFLLVQGRLKLIDFGIANAIDTDNTCNVHRESHVGTPNYMSPESITDTNGSSGNGRDAEGRPLKKDMKIGKASDVWSMGCILYQMTYGRPPFAHIPNQISRIMAITNPKVAIEYPERGIGGAIVPASLKGTLRRCLQRDPELRPTAKQLLSESDAFLNPEAGGAVMMSEDLLRQIIDKVVDRCRDPKKGVPTPEEVRTYPGSFMVKIREMVEKG